MKNKEFWDGAGKILLITALVIGLISLTLTISSRLLEKNVQNNSAAANAAEEINVINILIAGQADYTDKADDYSPVFANVKEMIANYDLAVCSISSLMGTDMPTQFGDAVRDAGFNIAGLANPGVLSGGKDGIDTAMTYWKDTGMHTAGINTSTANQNKIETFTVNNISIAFLSFTDSLNETLPDSEQYLVNVYDDEKTPLLVEKANEAADIVIVNINWKGTDNQQPNDRQKQIARDLADAGASVIIGNAPNAIQPIAWIDDTLVFYSTGNMISSSRDASAQFGLFGGVTISKTVSRDKQKIELFNPRAELCASTKDGSIYKVKLIDAVNELDMSNRDQIEETKNKVLLSMDDSIRIGGME
ncbi:MAG: hypothetical protein EOM64_10355 [Erysipelotrichia bacterium]|nr:hypothetical protein [Erysipelotrichia bacterium]